MALKMMELSDEVVSPHGEPIKVIYFIVFYMVKMEIFGCLVGFRVFVSRKFHINSNKVWDQQCTAGETDCFSSMNESFVES